MGAYNFFPAVGSVEHAEVGPLVSCETKVEWGRDGKSGTFVMAGRWLSLSLSIFSSNMFRLCIEHVEWDTIVCKFALMPIALLSCSVQDRAAPVLGRQLLRWGEHYCC